MHVCRQLEAGDVDGSAAEETRCTDADDKRTAGFDGRPADISTSQNQTNVHLDVEHEKSRERQLRQTRRDERLIHQMAMLDTADGRQVVIYSGT